ncbi:Chemotaxis protein CheC, inhibitor of MCP methylation [Hahella chejuensis KCTC 2396]|uniref:Chemotaxis protein CheC, inhibitor of MCP methylation n=1 Tax=Hahella chejuensis (strain KCTC 2396) TaxID=349521 RepID=Q2SGW5_HAHCH|nr:hypothetical protein [Hahella chejuensis]ABC30109.1 Chemotaxis protein CheC, inhibitor of MCP methylation [Hahella chejuensis KCTC 2396]
MLSKEQLDTFHEVVNIAMGQSSCRLANLVNHFVILSVPRLFVLTPAHERRPELYFRYYRSVIIQQSFSGGLKGEGLVGIHDMTAHHLEQFVGLDSVPDQNEDELYLDLGCLLVGSCVTSVSHQLMLGKIRFSQPTLSDCNVLANANSGHDSVQKSSDALLVNILLKVERLAF